MYRPYLTTILPTLLLATLIAHPAPAGKYNPVLSPGDEAPAWEKLPGVDGQEHSLADLRAKPVVVVVFTCNSCPYAVDYEDRTIAAAKKYADRGVAFVAINVNRVEADRLPAMKERAEAKKLPYPYLFDESQQIAKAYGAIWTPEYFVLDKNRQIVFLGGMDDNSNADQVTENYLEPAIEAALAGKQPQTAEAPARGCRIRFERARRKR